jgi:hypothetical protein
LNRGPIRSSLLPRNLEGALPDSDCSIANSDSYLNSFKQNTAPSHFPLNCLVPGWSGSNLPSHSSRLLKQVVSLLTEEATEQFYSFHFKNRSIKQTIYDEFLDYAHTNNLHFPESSIDFFWQQVQRSSSPTSAAKHDENRESDNEQGVYDFIEIYCYRVTIIYLMKLRLVLKLLRGNKLHEDTPQIKREQLLYPNSFLVKQFQVGSQEKLYCESLRSNPYSWYRPGESSLPLIEFLTETLVDMPSTALIKISSHPKECHLTHERNENDSKYSHALSHHSFGDYLKKILIHLPRWVRQEEVIPHPPIYTYPSSLSCKLVGQHLISIAHSHWLSQESAPNNNWSQLLSPDFQGSSFQDGHFVRVFNELSYLSFLVNYSITRMLRPQKLICNIFRQEESAIPGSIPLLSLGKTKGHRLYDRLVINLPTTRRRNPHHFLMQQIQQEMEYLKPDGFLMVFSGQNLFVPSQKERVAPLLEKLKLESYFNLEELKGRGELSTYIYIFSVKSNYPIPGAVPGFSPTGVRSGHLKESCLSFKFKGQLTTFNRLTELTDELTKFMCERDASSTPMFKKRVDGGLHFEFHQDAIIDGQLVQSSSSSDPSKITHPRFFDNLTRTCLPLDNFLQLEKLSQKDNFQNGDSSQHHPFDFLASSTPRYRSYNAILIINYQQRNNIKLEIIPSEIYPAKLEQLGTAYYQYFGIIPKSPEVNLNIFREYFESDIGCQVIQLTLHGPTTKLKPKLMALLAPKFFTDSKELPFALEDSLAPLLTHVDEIVKQLPQPIQNNIKKVNQLLPQLGQRYPQAVISILSQFKTNTEILINRMESSNGLEQIEYANPVVTQRILELETSPLFPNNEQFYINFAVNDPIEIRLPLSEFHIKRGEELHTLFLKGGPNSKEICTIIGKEAGISFLNYLFSNMVGTPIATILGSIQVPCSDELDELTSLLDDQTTALKQLREMSHQQINQVISSQISS